MKMAPSLNTTPPSGQGKLLYGFTLPHTLLGEAVAEGWVLA